MILIRDREIERDSFGGADRQFTFTDTVDIKSLLPLSL